MWYLIVSTPDLCTLTYFANKESLNIIETFSNLYVPLDCSEEDYVGFEIQFSLLKSIKLMLWGCNTLTVSLKTCLSAVCLLK